ncbi:MAG: phosphoenolpyruvate--protein phosphotransferase, partial [Leptospiraceae bacterium]|nr:phosphoenolpyruvate--protein phosphotransferase [Leptospiraceae bacterium]
ERGSLIGDLQIGVMIETPSSALNVDLFLEYVDFLSLGTNDLLQYFVAADRNNHRIANLYNPLNFAFLKTLKEIATKSNSKNKPVSICGELASDTNFTILLLGLGFREFSVSLPFLNKIQKIISKVHIHDAQRLANKVLELSAEERFDEAETYLFNLHLLEEI